MDYLLLGKITKPHGLKGEVKIFSKTDFASTRYLTGNVVFYFTDNSYKPLTVHNYFKQGIYDVVSFENYLDINLVKNLINKDIYIKKEDAKLPKSYYHFVDLINCDIISENNIVGKVIQVIEYPANIILRCKSKDKSFDIPFVDEFILNVDIKNKKIAVKLIEGML